jgi:hypothetical protein
MSESTPLGGRPLDPVWSRGFENLSGHEYLPFMATVAVFLWALQLGVACWAPAGLCHNRS